MLTSFLIWDSVPQIEHVVNFTDYFVPGLEVVIGIIGIVVWYKAVPEKRGQVLGQLSIWLVLVAALGWVADAKMNHRLSLLQSEELASTKKAADAAFVIESNKVVALESKYNEATNDLAIATKTSEGAKELLDKQKPKPVDERLRSFLDKLSPSILIELKSRKAKTFKGQVSEVQLNEFNMLCAEPDASKYIRILGSEEYIKAGDSLGGIGMQGGSFSTIGFILSTNLIK